MRRFPCFLSVLLLMSASGCNRGRDSEPASLAKGISADGSLVTTLGFQPTHVLEVPFQNDYIPEFLFSPDGKTLAGVGRGWSQFATATSDERGLIFLYDVETGALLKKLAVPASYQGGKRFLQRATWSLDGQLMAAWGENSQGMVSPLTLWNVASGQALSLSDPKWGASAAIWLKNGDLLVARTDQTNGLAPKAQLLVCDGTTAQIKKRFDLGEKHIPDMFLFAGETPMAVVLDKVGGDGKTRDPIYQGALCAWDGAALSRPWIQFERGDVPLRTAYDGESLLALTGVSSPTGGNVKSLVTMADLNRKKIVWSLNPLGQDFASQIGFSPDKKQVCLPGAMKNGQQGINIFDASSGALTELPAQSFPFFSPDGQMAARLLESNKRLGGGQRILEGERPHLKIAQILKR